MTCPTPTTKQVHNAKLMLPLASATSRKYKISSVIITFLTILRSAWLLHPSQQVQTLIPTKTTTSPYRPFSTLTMFRGKTKVIKDTSTKDNKDSNYRKNQTTSSAVTRSKVSKGSPARMNQQPKNVNFSSPPPKPSGHTNHQLTNDASTSSPKS